MTLDYYLFHIEFRLKKRKRQDMKMYKETITKFIVLSFIPSVVCLNANASDGMNAGSINNESYQTGGFDIGEHSPLPVGESTVSINLIQHIGRRDAVVEVTLSNEQLQAVKAGQGRLWISNYFTATITNQGKPYTMGAKLVYDQSTNMWHGKKTSGKHFEQGSVFTLKGIELGGNVVPYDIIPDNDASLIHADFTGDKNSGEYGFSQAYYSTKIQNTLPVEISSAWETLGRRSIHAEISHISPETFYGLRNRDHGLFGETVHFSGISRGYYGLNYPWESDTVFTFNDGMIRAQANTKPFDKYAQDLPELDNIGLGQPGKIDYKTSLSVHRGDGKVTGFATLVN